MMKKLLLLLVITLLVFSPVYGGQSNSRALLEPEMAQVKGMGWCGFFDGFAEGLGTTAAIAFFIPGAQGYAVGAGLTATLMKTAITLAC